MYINQSAWGVGDFAINIKGGLQRMGVWGQVSLSASACALPEAVTVSPSPRLPVSLSPRLPVSPFSGCCGAVAGAPPPLPRIDAREV